MTLPDYITRLQNHGKLPQEIVAERSEPGCADCGKRLTLDSEVSVSVCMSCQSAFLWEVQRQEGL